MPPPPVTPSPHRVVVKQDPAPVRRTPLAQSHAPHPGTQQFNATPRFTYSSTPRSTATQTLPAHSPAAVVRFTTPRPKPREEDDVIDDLSDDLLHDVHESIEHGDNDNEGESQYDSADNNDDFKIEEEPTPKRRRLTSPLLTDDHVPEQQDQHLHDQDEAEPSSIPTLPSPQPKRPQSSHHHHHQQHHKFLHSTLAPTIALPPSSSQKPFIKPPRFLPPEPSEHIASNPLPEQFSPHRKGQKYLPGGLASEVRDWLTNISSSVPAQQKNRDDPWVMRIFVDQVSGSRRAGVTCVKGRRVHVGEDGGEVIDYLAEVRCMLAGEEIVSGLQKGERVDVGKVVGVKGVVWEIAVEGIRWGVCVEWKVLR